MKKNSPTFRFFYEASIECSSDSDLVTVRDDKKDSKSKKSKYRLLKLKFQKFGGDKKDWIRILSQFTSIHEDEGISENEKFQYLIQATVDGSKARDVINSFPPSSDNYPKIIKYLTERFGKKNVLVKVT